MTPVALIGERQNIEAYLNTADGRKLAERIARDIFENEDRLADFEAGFAPELPAPVASELDRLIAARNARERA